MQDVEQCVFDLDELKEYVDLSSFRFMLVAISLTKIAIATSRYLVIMEELPLASNESEKDKIQTVVEFGEVSGRPTAIQWLNQSVLCVGFETGALACFNDFGETISEHEFSTSPLMAIHVLPSPDPTSNIQHIWALYENGFLISVPINHLLGGTSLARYYLKYKLVDHGMVNDFAVLSAPYLSSIFDADANTPLTSFVVSGIEPSMSLYTVGGKQHFQHFGKLASYVRDKVHSAISKTVGSALVSFFGSNSTANDQHEEGEDYTPLSSILDFQESDKRRILRLSLSPGGKLIAAADSLGRVLLFDARFATTVIRVWKGVREARFAWTEDRQQVTVFPEPVPSSPGRRSSHGSKTKRVLSLAIYAPQTGLLSLWALRHGPCLRSIPVGQQCHIFTVFDLVANEKEIQSRCALLRPDHNNRLHLSIVSPFGYSDEDIDLSTIQDPATDENENAETTSQSHLSVSFSQISLDEMRVYESIEKLLKSHNKKSATSSDIQTLEHRIWMNLSGLTEMSIIIRSIKLIEDYEIKNYNSYCKRNVPPEGLIFFSIQFHRNLCRLLEDVIFETKQFSSGDADQSSASRDSILKNPQKLPYVHYLNARVNLVKAYEMLLDINSQISLATTAPPGTENNKWGKQNNARAEAICWAARRLAPSTPSPGVQRLPSTSSIGSPSPTVSLLLRSSSLRNSFGPPMEVSDITIPTINSNSQPLTSLSHLTDLVTRVQEFISQSSSIPSPPPSLPSQLQRSTSTPPTVLTSFSNNLAEKILLPLSTFLLFHNCVASSILRPQKNSSNHYFFCFDEFALLLDMSEGHLPMLQLEDHATEDISLILREANPISAKEILALIFMSLLGDVFGLQKFSMSIDIMGLGGGLALRRSLPLMMAFMEAQSMSVVFNALVNRQLSASPLQRWIRDTLLAFHSFMIGEDDTPVTEDLLERKDNLLVEVMKSRETRLNDSAPDDPSMIPSIDEIVRYLLRPAWVYARKSLHLECTMIIAAQILEVLEAVGDQLERRTLGEINLNGTKLAWETLIRQLRVVMLLSSRAGGMLSVERLGSGEISIYSLLAADTLCFAMQADQAAEHELRCQDVYTRRAARPITEGNGTELSPQSSDVEAGGALLAWGPTADSRWKELVTVAEAEDAFLQEAASNAMGSSSSPRPGGSSSSKQSSKSKGSGSSKKIRRRRPLLLFFPTHNQPGPLGAYRGLALAERWARRPKRVEVLALAGSHLFSIPPMTRASVAERILLTVVFPLIRAYLDVEEGKIQKVNATDPAQELLIVMADTDLVENFVQSTVELLTFCLQGASSLQTSSPTKLLESDSTTISYEDELNPNIWPPANDYKLTRMIKDFQAHSGIGEVAAKWHMGLLWVLQLRSQCALRGVKISELFGSKILKTMCLSDSLSPSWPHTEGDRSRNQTMSFTSEDDFHSELEGSYHLATGSITSTHSPSVTSSLSDELHSNALNQSTPVVTLKSVREEFLLQCFRRLTAQSSNIVYSVAEIWDIDNTQARLVHLTTLLELGQDDIIAELINHFEDSSVTADRITQGLRVRIGNAISCLERIPACGSLLASLDPQALAWVRESVGPPDRAVVDGILKGKQKVINFDVPSTRHLVIRVQALLFGVSITNRDEKWMERKTKCDALLSLCSSLSESEVQSQLRGSGLMLS